MVQVYFINKGIIIGVRFFFNDYGQLINFEFFDCYDINVM